MRFNYHGHGWLEGEISEYRGEVPGRNDDEEEVLYHVWFSYPDDGAEVTLMRSTYSTRKDAPVESWHLIAEDD